MDFQLHDLDFFLNWSSSRHLRREIRLSGHRESLAKPRRFFRKNCSCSGTSEPWIASRWPKTVKVAWTQVQYSNWFFGCDRSDDLSCFYISPIVSCAVSLRIPICKLARTLFVVASSEPRKGCAMVPRFEYFHCFRASAIKKVFYCASLRF